MSKKVINVSDSEIRKNFNVCSSVKGSRQKADFRLKRFTVAKSQFSTATLCADPGSVFAALATDE